MASPKHFKPSKGKTLTESFLAACRAGQVNRAKSYLAQGADINEQDFSEQPNLGATGNTGLLWAFWGGRGTLARALLDAGADPRIPNAKGETALHVCPTNFIDEMLESGIDIDARDDAGRTPINTDRGIWSDRERMEKLLDRGANPFIRDKDGNDALDRVRTDMKMITNSGIMFEAEKDAMKETARLYERMKKAPGKDTSPKRP